MTTTPKTRSSRRISTGWTSLATSGSESRPRRATTSANRRRSSRSPKQRHWLPSRERPLATTRSRSRTRTARVAISFSILMVEQGYVSRADADKAKATPLKTAPNAGMSAASNYFVDVVQHVADSLHVPILSGGYRVYTTLDPSLQRDAVTSLVDGMKKDEARPEYKRPSMAAAIAKGSTDYLQGAVVAMDPYTGDVKALVGGRDYARGPYNRVTVAKRSPGSSFKPIVYAAAVEAGIPMTTMFSDDSTFSVPLKNGDSYTPREFEHEDATMAPMTMRQALILSRNRVAVQVGMQVGMCAGVADCTATDSVPALAARLGISAKIAPLPANAIGATAVRPIEMLSAYTAFVNSGQVVAPRFIVRIADLNGHIVLALPPSTPRQAIDPRAAFIIRDAMREVAERGTGIEAREALSSDVPMVGKTGTSGDNKDAWFMGLTPDLVAGVWVGFDIAKTIAFNAQGGTLAAPIWGSLMAKYYARQRAGAWPPPPDGIAYARTDRATGLLATANTPIDHQVLEYFLPGTEPEAMRNNPWNVPRWGPIIIP